MDFRVELSTICLLVASTSINQEPARGSALWSLVEAERAFSRLSVEQGARAAFLAFFADEGVSFEPEPVRTKEAIRKQPATPPTAVLEWAPVTADVARAGDIGYTTGPWVRSERKPAGKPLAFGWYFTVWKKQPDGSWKAVADIGMSTPPHTLPAAGTFRPADPDAPVSPQPRASRAGDVLEIEAIEKRFADAAATGALDAYVTYGTESVRLHRDGLEPVVGTAAVTSYFAGKQIRTSSTVLKADVSRSGDLGYAYGQYVSRGALPGKLPEERGSYLRVWKRGARGWRLVADIAHPAPSKK